MARPAKEAVILFAHGARDPQWAEPFQRLQERIRLQRPHIEVEIAFLELLPPTLLAAVDQLCDAGVTHVTIVPLFLASGAHVQRDLPELVTQAQKMYPRLTIRLLPTLGESEPVLDATAAWIASRLRKKPRQAAGEVGPAISSEGT